MSEGKVHHMTLKRMVRDGELTQELADEVRRDERTVEDALAAMQKPDVSGDMLDGNDSGPGYENAPKPKSRLDKYSANAVECLCGCGQKPSGKKARWVQGHDARSLSWCRKLLTGELSENDFTSEQRDYMESSGKLEKMRQQLEKEERKRQQKAQEKAERQSERKQSDS